MTAKILVIGDMMLDTYLMGECSRISPEAPVGVVHVKSEHSVLGGAGNVLNNIVSLGAGVDIMSVVGRDANAEAITELLASINVSNTYLITEENRPTTTKTRVLAAKQQVIRYDHETTSEILEQSENQLLTSLKEHISEYNIIIFSDYGKGVLTQNITTKVIALANQYNVKVLVDPKGTDYRKYFGAYLLTPNKKEAEEATSMKITLANVDTALQALKDIAGLKKSIITLSEEGIAVYDDTVRIHPTRAKEVFDVTGAGDTVIAALAVKMLETDDIDEVIQFANAAAGVVVGKIGSATATIEEIRAYSQQYSFEQAIQSIDSIAALCTSLKQQGKSIVFTNGCFDILHMGHVKYLTEAKKHGDVLIVGVNTNDSVKRLKGESRPINDEYDRAFILAGLAAVDYVVLFSEDTPYELITLVQPDVLVKGADYEGKEVVGSDIARRTELIEFVAGKSTTKIINKISG